MPTLSQLLSQLQQEKHIEAVSPAEIDQILLEHLQNTGANTPWYLRMLMGFGGWFAGLFFLSFFICFGILNSPISYMYTGVLMLVVAIALRHMCKSYHQDVLIQLALSWVIAGQLSIAFGINSTYHNTSITCMVVMALACALLFLYPDPIQRFASTVTFFNALPVLLYTQKIPFALDWNICLITLLTTMSWLYWTQGRSIWPLAIAYGLCVTLFLNLLSILIHDANIPSASYLSTVALGLALVYTAIKSFPSKSPDVKSYAISFLAFVLIAICMAKSPGIAAGLLVLTLGIHRQNQVLMGIAGCYLLLFGSHFYYSLEMDFLQKSISLVLSGVITLALRSLALHLHKTPKVLS